ncbi:hypothetical protein [Halobacillus karajensis]|uniref:Uncharacterized protein n=1 Tax=Halobacillus karajensis TaxID=195088 RepID=A0A059NYK0_9BACI|nr:hypothetical protein [Halobacillus karajensis]CDQ22557.1 hypothetical protein BN983_00770 [Halobacillus karajensis]CDQ26039.1 hypothetical protein BN981_00250 [Halobacillus karajensis]
MSFTMKCNECDHEFTYKDGMITLYGCDDNFGISTDYYGQSEMMCPKCDHGIEFDK